MSTRFKRGKLRADKVQFEDGIGCCVWYPFPPDPTDPDDDEDCGICFDFAFEDIDDMISLLQELKTAEPEIYKDDSGQA